MTLAETQPADSEDEFARATGAIAARGLTLVRGQGERVWDETGREFIDCTSAYGVAPLGHAHPDVVAALQDQAARLIACQASFGNDQRRTYLSELAEVVPGSRRFFLCNSGTEANEAALKIARLQTKRTKIVACMRGFHGRTMGSLSATWDRNYRTPFAPLVPEFEHIPFDDVPALEQAVDDQTAALIIEVIQGEGGVRPASAAFLRAAREVCDRTGALLILDEVQTGFGRTGRLFACEHEGIRPDLISLAKGIANGFPMGAVGMGERVDPLPRGSHGSTFGGNPLASAAARATLRVLLRDRLVERSATLGARMKERLEAMDHEVVREVRAVGMMIGIELRTRVQPFVKALQERGILVIAAGPTVLRLLPPLVMADAVARRVCDEIDAVLKGASA